MSGSECSNGIHVKPNPYRLFFLPYISYGPNGCGGVGSIDEVVPSDHNAINVCEYQYCNSNHCMVSISRTTAAN